MAPPLMTSSELSVAALGGGRPVARSSASVTSGVSERKTTAVSTLDSCARRGARRVSSAKLKRQRQLKTGLRNSGTSY